MRKSFNRLVNVTAFCVLLISSTFNITLHAAYSYEIHTTGLTGHGYEREKNDGIMQRISLYGPQNNAGMAIGYSFRYIVPEKYHGADGWVFDGYQTKILGLAGNDYSRMDGDYIFRKSFSHYINEAGHVVGFNWRLGSKNINGQDTWYYDGTNTTQIGLSGNDYEYLASDGGIYRHSEIKRLYENGTVIGYTKRYNASGYTQGKDIWVYDGSTSNRVNPTTGYLSAGSYVDSTIIATNGNGHILGQSGPVEDYNPLRHIAWQYNGSTSQTIGLNNPNGAIYKESFGVQLNNNGLSVGYSTGNGHPQAIWLHNGNTNATTFIEKNPADTSDMDLHQPVFINNNGVAVGTAGRDGAWLYDGTNTHIIKPQHNFKGNIFKNEVIKLTDSGFVIGKTYHRYKEYAPPANILIHDVTLGHNTWISDGTTTRSLGLTGDIYEYTIDPDEPWGGTYTNSYVRMINESGVTVGVTARARAVNLNRGPDLWYDDGSSVSIIGLYSHEFKYFIQNPSDGSTFKNNIFYLTESGFAGGTTNRYRTGRFSTGQSGWVYDPSTDQTYELTFSKKTTGHAYTQINGITEEGLAYGYYNLYDDENNDLGKRAFLWSVEDGFIDLTSMVTNLDDKDWQYLGEVKSINENGNIVGWGALNDMDGWAMTFILNPTVIPEPSSIIFLSVVTLIFPRRSRCSTMNSNCTHIPYI
ncbi:hypothetical protein [Poriferisphaera sp. WC338]|uniref:hypothetical protein n=1 Tax=Poriferisphaera sp. WC338 TaxID=3425129 RepID=UPI003D8191C3